MLECELCDYLVHLSKEEICKCDFTGHVFIGRKGFDLDEYPCRNRSYEEYLQRGRGAADADPRLQKDKGNKEKKVFRLYGDDWRIIYRKCHPEFAAGARRGSSLPE